VTLCLRDGLRSGDVFVPRSRRYADPSTYLYTPRQWAPRQCRHPERGPADAADFKRVLPVAADPGSGPAGGLTHVFITGGSGLTGPAVISELIAAGHTVTGLARSDAAAARLQALGVSALRGSCRTSTACGQAPKARTG